MIRYLGSARAAAGRAMVDRYKLQMVVFVGHSGREVAVV